MVKIGINNEYISEDKLRDKRAILFKRKLQTINKKK